MFKLKYDYLQHRKLLTDGKSPSHTEIIHFQMKWRSAAFVDDIQTINDFLQCQCRETTLMDGRSVFSLSHNRINPNLLTIGVLLICKQP